jgi:CHASE2 domain-containing sensor protein
MSKLTRIILCGHSGGKFLTSFIVGLVILFLLKYFPISQQVENVAMDFMIGLFKGIITETNNLPPIILLDINEESYQKWEHPLFMPRDKLLTLIERAVESQPKIIIVDVDLSSRSLNSESDSKLLDFLKKYSTNCQSYLTKDNNHCPQILLLQTLDYPIQEKNPWRKRVSFLDEAVKASEKDIHWGWNFFTLENNFVRQQQLWEAVCTAEGRGYIIPSFSLLTIALLKERSKSWEELRLYLHQHLDQFRPQDCHKSDPYPIPVNPDTLWLGSIKDKRKLSLRSNKQRIIYKFPWKSETERPKIRWQKQLVKLLDVIPAYSVIEWSSMPESFQKQVQGFQKQVQGRIVIIGGSFRESRDIYMTPLDEMPGFFIIANMIYSLWQGDIKPLSHELTLFIEVVLIWITICLFTIVDKLFFKLNFFTRNFTKNFIIHFIIQLIKVVLFISLILSIPLLISFLVGIISFYWFQQGVWLDFLLPLVAVILHHLADVYIENLQSKGKRSEL